LKSCCQLILDVRTSAHPQCVTGHPKASSRPTRLRKRSTSGLFLSVVLRVSKETESRQTVKLTLHHRAETLEALICRHLIHRMNQCRPHISSDTCDVKERERQKPDQCALTCGALPVMPSNSVPPRLQPAPRSRLAAAPSGVPSAPQRRR